MKTIMDVQRVHSEGEPICKVLPLAPSTDDRHAGRQADSPLQSARSHSDTQRMTPIQAVWQDNFQADGGRKICYARRNHHSAVVVAGTHAGCVSWSCVASSMARWCVPRSAVRRSPVRKTGVITRSAHPIRMRDGSVISPLSTAR